MKQFHLLCRRAEALWYDDQLRSRLLNTCYLLILALYLIEKCLGTTMLGLYPPETVHKLFRYLLILLLFVKFAANRPPVFRDLFAMLAFGMVFLAAWEKTGNAELLDQLLLIVGAYQLDYKKLLYTYLAVTVPITVYTIIGSQLGWVQNLIYYRGAKPRISFGFVYPTDFAAHIFYLAVVWFLLRQKKTTIWELGIWTGIAALLYHYCDARCSVACILLLIVCIGYLKLRTWLCVRRTQRYVPSKALRIVCILAPVLFCGLMLAASYCYREDSSFWVLADKLVSHRLQLGRSAFDQYSVPLFGQEVWMMGFGGTTEWPEVYFFLDCSYLNMLLRFGIFILLAVLLLHTIVMLRNRRNIYMLGLVMAVCLHSMIEHHMLECWYNPFLLLLFVSFAETGKKSDIQVLHQSPHEKIEE